MYPLLALVALAGQPQTRDVGPLVRALWLVQRYGAEAAADPANDQRLKGAFSKALSKGGELSLSKLDGFMEPDTFKKLAGSDGQLGLEDIGKAVDAAVPESRGLLLNALNPEAILQRGYAIVRQAGQPLRSSKRLTAGAIVDIQLVDGRFSAAVTKPKPEKA